MEKMIEIRHVSKSFKGENVLQDINLDLYENHIYGFVGRNGSGKSVLFKLICGYLHPDLGDVTVRGKQIGKDVDFPENLGALIENPGFLWQESAMSNLLYLAKITGKIGKREVMDAIRKVGLDPLSRKHVGKYSLGMKQRLGIAQAIMEDLDILILDEPMNGLDESGIDEMRNLILEFRRPGKIVLIASHNKEDIQILCDEVYEMKNGKICNRESEKKILKK